MKEVRLRYPAHAIAQSEFRDQVSICQEAVLMASVSRNYEQNTIVYVLQLTLADGMAVEDIDRVPWFRLIEVIGEEVVGGLWSKFEPIWTASGRCGVSESAVASMASTRRHTTATPSTWL